jgi:glycosyltransferase involved in cell wall biosynthesis
MIARGRPVVLKLTGTVPPERISKFPAEQQRLWAALGRADEVWCNSRFAVAEMAAFDVPMRVVPAGIDIGRFHPSGSRSLRPTVLCTSTPDDPRKRVVDVIDAWPDVVAAVPDAQLLVTGHSDGSRDRFVARLPATARASVVFTGVLDDDALLAAYRSAWVAVTPSVFEALGLTTLEALACGTPVVGADSGATSELVAEAGVGALYGAADPHSCARALVSWLDTPPSAGVTAWCVAAAAPYAWEVVAETIAARYDALVGRA